MVVGYNPSDGDGEERERFWNELDRVVDRVGNGYRLCARISEYMDRVRVDITGIFRAPGENDNVRRVVEFCA